MAQIHVLSSGTINRIAAGEVVERPANVVKELAENSIDAGATAVTIEIRGGGIDLIRVTDNGCGIEPSQVRQAFLRHATSKIGDAGDLLHLSSLGFRGEALSSIAAVSEVEMITKTRDSLFGIRAVSDPAAMAPDGKGPDAAMELQEIGAPDGTSVIVRNLFCNVPVRRKFLKSAQTEGSYVSDLVGHLSLSRPDISFHFRMNGQEKLHTTGHGSIPELIYRIYGKEMARSAVPFAGEDRERGMKVCGYLGRPEFSRASRSFEMFFVNGRMLRSDVLSKGLEEGYRTDLMQHRFPFAVVYLTAAPEQIDVNVHPSKMEVRFTDPKAVYDLLNESVHAALRGEELIPHETMDTRAEEKERLRDLQRKREEEEKSAPHVEAFEPERSGEDPLRQGPDGRRTDAQTLSRAEEGVLAAAETTASYGTTSAAEEQQKTPESDRTTDLPEDDFLFVDKTAGRGHFEQESLFAGKEPPDAQAAAEYEARRSKLLSENILPYAGEDSEGREPHLFTKETVRGYRLVGQVFGTYWIIEYGDRLLMIDQHAAHEKVNFERLMARLSREQSGSAASQMLMPPIIVNLSGREEAALEQYMTYFTRMGYEIEPFGENSYAIRAVPAELYANEPDALLREILDEILDSRLGGTPAAILYKIASMSCKAAVKGSSKMSVQEAQDLIDELLMLDNPYHCPHGRPTMIVLSRSEIDRKFKRIVS